jgi:hypothetical protein
VNGNFYTYGAFGKYASNKPTYAASGTSGWVGRFMASNAVPTALENRPASLSALIYITY